MIQNKYSTENILNEIRIIGETLTKIDSANISTENYLVLENYLKPLHQLKQLFDSRYSISKENKNDFILFISYFLYNYILGIINNIGTDVDEYTPIEIWKRLLKKVGNELMLIADSIKFDNKMQCFDSCSKLTRYYYIALDEKRRGIV